MFCGCRSRHSVFMCCTGTCNVMLCKGYVLYVTLHTVRVYLHSSLGNQMKSIRAAFNNKNAKTQAFKIVDKYGI